MLLVLVREFESPRGEILNLSEKTQRINCRERIAWVSTIRRESTREERAGSSRDKNARHEPYWVGGEESLLYDRESDLRPGERERIEGRR